MTDVAYKPLTFAEKTFKELVWDPGVKAGVLALEGYVPFLGLPVVRTITEKIIGVVTDLCYAQLVLFADIGAIRLVNSEHQAEYDKASLQLKVLATDYGPNSPEFLKGKEDAKAALAKFLSYGAA